MDELSALGEHGYEVRGRIGSGGMGTVYHAYQTAMKRDVAIKVLPDDLANNPNYFVRFNREAETLTQLEHPHIVPVYDYGTVGQTSYIVMRLLTGGSLSERLSKGDVLTLVEIWQLVRQLASALNYAHAKNIIHRDIKASNVMLDEQGNAYLTDFGIAKLLDAIGFTATGMTLGTPAYMAPEQWQGEDSSPQTDIYALGVLLYTMLAGELPFQAPTPYALMDKHLNEHPTPPTVHRPQLPGTINAVLDKALAKDPAQRYHQALDLAQDFEQALGVELASADDPQRTAVLEEVATTLGYQDDPERHIEAAETEQGSIEGPGPAAGFQPGRQRRMPLALIALVLVLILGSAVLALSGVLSDGEDSLATATSDEGFTEAAANPTATETPAPSSTPSDTPAPTATLTPLSATDVEGTVQAQMGAIQTAERVTQLAAQTATATAVQGVAFATSVVLTQTAAAWSPTPTPDTRATAQARLTATQQQILGITATADTWTDTPTSTFTPASTFTPTNTPTDTFTPTSTPTLTPLEVAEQGVSSNTEWQAIGPIGQIFDDVEMMLVPAGCFMMGSEDGHVDEEPVHEICFDAPFWIDRYEVSQRQFERLGGTQAEPPDFPGDDRPVDNITWLEARDFCEQRGGRLPTEAEWEYAARGPDSLVYPWGNEFDRSVVNYCDENCTNSNDEFNDGFKNTAPIGSYENASWVGAYDMSGNVSEWTSTIYMNYSYPYDPEDGREDADRTDGGRVLRGGSWLTASSTSLRGAARSWGPPVRGGGRSNTGFRCAGSYTLPTASDTPAPALVSREIAEQGVSSNAEWQAVGPLVEEFDGVEMVLVPAGTFTMGSDDAQQQYAYELCEAAEDEGGDCQTSWFEDEGPAHPQTFEEPFWIDRTEVTRAMYQACVAAGECEQLPSSNYSTEDNQPINRVTWFQAQTYCEWRGARLPTEAEWEYAARGPDSLRFPWGNEFDGTLANHCDRNCAEADWSSDFNYKNEENDDGYAITSPVGSFPEGVSWVGAYDMSGNVWEWTSSVYMEYPYDAGDGREDEDGTDIARVLRGGSFNDMPGFVRPAVRGRYNPGLEHYFRGFRCARSYDANDPSIGKSFKLGATPTPTPTNNPNAFHIAEQGVSSNAQWEAVGPVIREFNGVEMVLVPAGCFMMGSTDEQIDYAASFTGNRDWFENEQPVHEICFDEPFWIDRYEVTNEQYGNASSSAMCFDRSSEPDQPRNCVNWFETRDFCAWRSGARLPTEAEWEYVARGPDGLIYPWGNEFIEDYVGFYMDSGRREIIPVGSVEDGISWVGAYDMIGNVAEWTGSIRAPYPYSAEDGREDEARMDIWRILRDNSLTFRSTAERGYFRAASRNSGSPEHTSVFVGFRCARSYTLTSTGTPTPSATPTPTVTLNATLAANPDAFQLAERGVNRNGEWQSAGPVVREFDGVEMVLVPAGCFMMGSENERGNERPLHEICFDEPFWIDRYEVIRDDFKRMGGTQAESSNIFDSNYPVDNVSWLEARDFCTARGMRLPTEAEWEYAARGPDGLIYPWGDEFEPHYVVWAWNNDFTSEPVGSRPNDVSWVGAYDMTSSVLEWTSSIYTEYPYNPDDGRENDGNLDAARAVRGGTTSLLASSMRTSVRQPRAPSYRMDLLGFRCAHSYPDTPQPTFTPRYTPTPSITPAYPSRIFEIAEQGVSTNAEWEAVGPVVREFDRVEMVLVPAGCFIMGDASDEDNEQSGYEVCFDEPFWIDRYEWPRLNDHPAGGVNSTGSWHLCQSRQSRLPTEAEWEYAARGPDGLVYPWGNEFIEDYAVYAVNSQGQTDRVDSHPEGASWVGAHHMVGNVWEWTVVFDDPSQAPHNRDLEEVTERVLKGGSFSSSATGLRTTYRNKPGLYPRTPSYFGFRCARDYQP